LEGYLNVDLAAAIAFFFDSRRHFYGYDSDEHDSLIRGGIFTALNYLKAISKQIKIYRENIFLSFMGCLCLAMKSLDDRRVFNADTATFVPGMDTATLNHIEMLLFKTMMSSSTSCFLLY
jgi:hypothetical protein